MAHSADAVSQHRRLRKRVVLWIIPFLLLVFGDVRQWVIGKALDGTTHWISSHYRFLAYIEFALIIALLILVFSTRTPSLEQQSLINAPLRAEVDRLTAIINTSATLNEMIFPVLSNPEIPVEVALDRVGLATLRDLSKVINPIQTVSYRASIWVGDDDDDFLVPISSIDMPDSSLSPTRFYIGKGNSHPSGTAGAVFRSGKLRVVHLVPGPDGDFISDDPDFVPSKTDNGAHQYRSFISVPMKPAKDELPIGVICIDSGNVRTFDDASVQFALERYATMVGQLVWAALFVEQIDDS